MTRHETNFSNASAVQPNTPLPEHLVPPAASDAGPVPDVATASRMIAAVIYGHAEDAKLTEAGAFLIGTLKTLSDPHRPGPDIGEPELGLRHRKGKPAMIVIMNGSKYGQSTGVRVRPGEDYRKNPKALAKLADYRYRRAMGDLMVHCSPLVTIADIIDEWTADHEPKTEAMKERHGKRYQQMCTDGAKVAKEIGHYQYAGPIAGIGLEYANKRTAQPRGNCSPDNPDPGLVAVETSRIELKSVRQMIRYHCGKWNKPVKLIELPKEEKKGRRFITWYQFMQFLLACRGWLFDQEGNLIRDAVVQDDGSVRWVPRRLPRAEWEQFEMVERFAILYWYGLRHTKARQMRWGFNFDWGYFDFVNGLVVRSGQTAPLTNKQAVPSLMIGSLERFARKWKKKDDARRFKHVIHHADGSPRIASMQTPFQNVADNAGLPWLRPHHLKHSAVTLCAYAGMPIPALMEKFSTSYRTLTERYTHLRPFWTLGATRPWSPENVGLLALKKSSPLPDGYPRVGGQLPPR